MACCHYVPVEGGESAFSVDRNAITFGHGVLEEVRPWARALGLSRVAVMTDPRVGTIVQRRLLDNAPLPVDRELLAGLFEDALTCW